MPNGPGLRNVTRAGLLAHPIRMTAIQTHQDRPDGPSPEALIDTVTEMIDRMLTPDEPDTGAAMAFLDGLLDRR